MKTLDEILLTVEKPSRYIGGECGEPNIKKEKFNFCICFPDVYEVAMSNLGIRIVQEVINGVDGAMADRCFAPWPDFGSALKENQIPLYSLGLRLPLNEFDMLGFSLQFELSYTTVLYMLDLAGIPLYAKDRGDNYPIIQGGGPCAVNPEPIADFFDIFVIGDGEDAMRELAMLKLKTTNKAEFLQKATEIEGVYVPSLTYPVYDENGKIIRFEGKRVRRAICLELENATYPKTQTVGNVEAVHDRAVIEVMRGCYRGCRFCQAGFIYRPVRQKSVDNLTKTACALIRSTGFDTLSMNSLSTSDYKDLKPLLNSLKENLPTNTKISLPSLRIDSFDEFYAQEARKNSLTFAPEAGTQRLRDVINKDITDDDIKTGAEKAFKLGYSLIKLYFMMGLPTETEDDIAGIRRIIEGIREIYAQNPKRLRGLRINVSLSTFVPKPFTPFQWEEFISFEQFKEKLESVKKHLFAKGVTVSWNDYETSELEVALARGDRNLSKVIYNAYKKGCIYDSWGDFFSAEKWNLAFEQEGVEKQTYKSVINTNDLLAWDFLDVGVSKDFLLKEKERAEKGLITGGCQTGCKVCGLQKDCPIVNKGV